MVVDAVQEHLGGAGDVSFDEGGRDPRNYRVTFDKIRDGSASSRSSACPRASAT